MVRGVVEKLLRPVLASRNTRSFDFAQDDRVEKVFKRLRLGLSQQFHAQECARHMECELRGNCFVLVFVGRATVLVIVSQWDRTFQTFCKTPTAGGMSVYRSRKCKLTSKYL